MNRLTLNSGSLGGAVRGLVLATAAIVCASTVDAVAVRVAQATASVTAHASVTPALTYNHTTTQASISGFGNLYPNAVHVHAAKTQLLGSNVIQAYVLRTVPSAATVITGVDIIAVVASYQGVTALTGTALVVPQATRVQAAFSSIDGYGFVDITVAPTVYRMHAADVVGQAVLQVEPSIRAFPLSYTEHPAYIDVAATTELTANAICYREAYANLDGQVFAIATGTLEQPGFAAPYANAIVILADSYIKTSIGAYVTCAGTITASAVINKLAVVTLLNSSEIQATAVQKHGSLAVVTGFASVNPIAFATLPAITVGTANVVLTAQATIFKVGQADITAASLVTPGAVRTTYGLSNYLGIADLAGLATPTLRLVETNVIGSANLAASLELMRYASTNLDCGVSIQNIASRLITVTAEAPINFLGSALVYVDTVANPESYDPFERTFTRPIDVVEFTRPFIETEFRRAYEAGYDLQATR